MTQGGSTAAFEVLTECFSCWPITPWLAGIASGFIMKKHMLDWTYTSCTSLSWMPSHPWQHWIKRKTKKKERKKRGGEPAAASSLTTGELKTLILVDQKRDPHDPAGLHFYNAETLAISGYDETEETLSSSQSSRRTRSFLRPKNERQKKRGKKKKLKWLTAHRLPSKRLPREWSRSGWWRNRSSAFSQALLILLSHLQSHIRTPSTKEERRKRKKERTRAERVNRDLLPGCQWCWRSGDQSSLSHSTNQVCTINLGGMTLMDIWSNDVCPLHSTQAWLPARESLTETRHMHTHNLEKHESECNTPI